jgi:phage terminase large subunit-like protein
MAARTKTCAGCSAEKPAKDFAKTEFCGLCRADGTALLPKQTEYPPDLPRVEVEEPSIAIPRSEIDYSSPSMQELAARTLARRSLLAFIKRFKPKYLPGWVHEDICRRLERFMKDVEDGKEPRLLLMMPVRHGKSEISSRHFAPFVLGHHPDWEIIAASGASSLALSFSRYIRDLIRDPSFQAVFPRMKLDPTSQSVENWNTTEGGGYLAAGIGTMITGRGAHILIIDDPVKDAEAADSQGQRDSTWEWYISTALSRLAPGGGVLGILTWWNEDDWAGRIQQLSDMEGADKFEIVKYPAINDLGNEYILADDEIVQLPPGSKIPDGARMTRPMNTALHPVRYSLASLLKRKATYYALGQQRWWAALYQQNPTPEEGAYFTKKMFRTHTHTPKRAGCVVFQAWDFAITEGEANDWTVGCTLMQDENDILYVLDINRFKSGDGIDIMDVVVEYAMDWKPDMIGFEDGQIWKALESTFNKTCELKKYYPSYEVLKPFTDKFVRAQPLRGRMQAGKLSWPSAAPWYDALRTEFLKFGGGGKHDDQIDAVAWAVRLTLMKSAPRPAAPKVEKSWKDKLNSIMNGQGGESHMAS